MQVTEAAHPAQGRAAPPHRRQLPAASAAHGTEAWWAAPGLQAALPRLAVLRPHAAPHQLLL
jgi:hypothetical protein